MLTDAVRIRKYFLLHTSSFVIDRYSNFGNTYLSKEFARILNVYVTTLPL